MKYYPLFLGLLFCTSAFAQSNTESDLERISKLTSISVIAFGSCNEETGDQTFWNSILEQQPDLWLWMGDNIYGEGANLEILAEAYQKQASNTIYQQFNSQVPVAGTWDDNDYGPGDGNKLYEDKEESKQLLLDFLNIPDNHETRDRAGVYHSFECGQAPSVRIILLDTRSFQDVLQRNPDKTSRYLPSEGDILGDTQWQWLEGELERSEAELNIIVTSIQFVAEEHKYEKWSNFPNSRRRMLDLLRRFPNKRVLMLSGDRHLAEISKMQIDGLPYPLYDITSSGLTHSYESAEENNRYRIMDLIDQKNFGLIKLRNLGGMLDVTAEILGTDGQIFESIKLELY